MLAVVFPSQRFHQYAGCSESLWRYSLNTKQANFDVFIKRCSNTYIYIFNLLRLTNIQLQYICSREGKGGACVRRCVAAVPIAVSAARSATVVFEARASTRARAWQRLATAACNRWPPLRRTHRCTRLGARITPTRGYHESAEGQGFSPKGRKRKGGSMRQKARCCSAHRCLCGHWPPGGRHTCLYTCSPAW